MLDELNLSNGTNEKNIKFYKDGKYNEKQIGYFNSIFNDNLQYNNINIYDEYAYFGAFRCSKSFSQQLAVFLLCLRIPKLKAIYVRDTYDQLKDSVIKQFLDEFQFLDTFKYRVSERLCKFHNGSELRFRAFDYDTNILSSEYDVIGVCQAEDINYELFLQLIGRASGKVLGSKGILLVEGNPSSGWCKDRYKDATKEDLKRKRIFFTEGETQDNPFVTKEYIQSLIDNYPKFWLDRYLYGFWDNREELIFDEFNEQRDIIDIIDPKSIPKPYVKRNGLDWGWVNPTALLRSFLDYDGNIVIYDEYYSPKTLPETLKTVINRYGKIITVADYNMKGLKMPTRENENRTVWSELEFGDNGVLLTECNKEEMSNIVMANTLFKQNKVKITRNCVNFIREVKNWKWKRLKLGQNKNMPEEPVDKDNHTCDCLNYLVGDLFREHAIDPKETEFKRSLQYHVIRKNMQYQSHVQS